MKHPTFAISAVAIALFLMLINVPALGQAGGQFEARAMGEGVQMGQSFGVTINIREFSTPEDQKILIEAFNAKGMKGLMNAVGKMPAKGRIAITGTLGFNVNYIRVFETPTGRRIRLVTDRPITFGEAWTDSRSQEYSLSAVDLEVGPDGKGTGTLLPACQLKMSKQNELEVEAFRNPWRLVDVFEWKK
jgi:hypothetical protein